MRNGDYTTYSIDVKWLMRRNFRSVVSHNINIDGCDNGGIYYRGNDDDDNDICHAINNMISDIYVVIHDHKSPQLIM